MIKVVYNEGQGFTEYTKEYNSLKEAIENEIYIAEARIYKNITRIQ